jgi:hypothetical protein
LTVIIAAGEPALGAPSVPSAEAISARAAPAFQAVQVGGTHTTRPFSLVGVTWTDPHVGVDGVVQVRTRAVGSGRWSSWQSLEADGGPGTRGATDPLWVGVSYAVESRVVGARKPLPAGLRVDLINPDAGEPLESRAGGPLVESGAGGPQTESGAAGPLVKSGAAVPLAGSRAAGSLAAAGGLPFARRSVPLPARPVPRMVTRAGWGVNESMVRAAPEFTGPVEVFFVHHTASGNGYSCSQSASIVRGIQGYQVRGRGWDDIGYNFLIDKCGTIFEGRGGGVGRSVLGAHTLGFNADASAIAVIGTYDRHGVSTAVRTAIATVAAYKLGAYGNNPNGRVVLTSGGSDRFSKGRKVVLNRISGHRDAGRTECPGNALYAQLPSIRTIAGAAPFGLRVLRVRGSQRYGALLFSKGLIKPLWNVRTPSALINRFEVWVDGVPKLAAPGFHRTAALRLAPGGHTVTVRALHLSGRSTTSTVKVVSDPNAPAFTSSPDVVLRTGSLNGTVPIRLNWTASDVNGLSAVGLVRPTSVNLGTTSRVRNGTVAPAVPTTFMVRAVDRAGNAVNASVTRTPMVVSEYAAQRTGTWRRLTSPAYLSGVALGGTAAGASASWTFTGRSAALAVGRGAQSGKVRIWVDGDDQGVIDLKSSSTLYRQAIWARSWTTSDSHSVRVEVVTPGVVLDGLVYIK